MSERFVEPENELSQLLKLMKSNMEVTNTVTNNIDNMNKSIINLNNKVDFKLSLLSLKSDHLVGAHEQYLIVNTNILIIVARSAV